MGEHITDAAKLEALIAAVAGAFLHNQDPEQTSRTRTYASVILA